MTTPTIELLPLGSLKPAKRNPKAHDIPAIQRSFRRWGFVLPLVQDARSGRLVAGHGRLQALQEMRANGEPPPAQIAVQGDDWAVPVLTGVSFANEREAEGYLIADNRLVELGGHDKQLLAEVLQSMDSPIDAGWEDREIRKLLKLLEPAHEIRDVLPDGATPRAQVGDVWTLGDHVVWCGDCRSVLPLSEPVHCVMTDPPYGVDYLGGGAAKMSRIVAGAHGKKTSRQSIADDAKAPPWAEFWPLIQRSLKPGGPWFVWHATGSAQWPILEPMKDELRQTLIWVKDRMVIGRRDFQSQFEPVAYGWRSGAAHERQPNRKLSDVLEHPRPSKSPHHPTAKPVPVIAHWLSAVCVPGDLVLDPFGGSGTTLLACHQLGLRARLIELETRHVDTTLARWEALTGQQAQLTHRANEASAAPKKKSKRAG